MRRLFGVQRSRPTYPDPAFPIRAIFYYPWFPSAWDQLGYNPFTRYTPELGFYDSDDNAALVQHMKWIRSAGIDAVIISWWGQPPGEWWNADYYWKFALDAALQVGLKACIYYEWEGYDNPSAAQIADDLDYLADLMAHPAYLHVDGRPVVFVFSAGDTSSGDVTTRWSQATSGYTTHYVSLKKFTGYASEPDQPDSWHEYDIARTTQVAGHSYIIMPGWWRIDEVNPRLTRDLAAWQANVASMVASGEPWQLIISFNEFSEGTIIEPSEELGSAYLDALAGA